MPYIIPHIFKAGEKAIAEQVNSNFNYIKESLDQLNSTLGTQISNMESSLSGQIEDIETQSENISTMLDEMDAIVKLGTIVPPDPLEDGQIPTAQISLSANKIHTAAILANSQIILPTLESNDKLTNILFEFTIASDYTLSLPLNIKWSCCETPELIADGVTINRLLFDTTTNGTNWCGYFGFHNIISVEEEGNE